MRERVFKWALICIIASLLSGTIAFYYMRPYLPRSMGGFNQEPAEQQEIMPPVNESFPGWEEKVRKRALAVIIDNAPQARPQTGLEAADVIVELPVEGGLTRFLAIIAQDEAEIIGPVRSARPYIVDAAKEYEGILVHAGGSLEALEAIKREELNNMDEISGSLNVQGAFWRIPDRTKPHNLYASIESLRQAAVKEKYSLSIRPLPYPYIEKDKELNGKKAEDITIFYPNRDCEARFVYSREKKAYARYTAGSPHLTEKGDQLLAANIVIQFVPYRYTDGDGHLEMILHGQGKALFFRDGKVLEGNWQKTPGKSTIFTDKTGQKIEMIPGPIWIQVVNNSTRIDY